MSNTTTTMFGMIALFAVGMIFSPLAASAVVPYPDYNGPQRDDNDGNYLDIKKVIVKDDGDVITDIIYKIGGFIPLYETVDPFGYGVITEVPSETGTGTELNVIATTSHAGLLDSEAQEGDPDNPILHNHYAVLGSNLACGSNPSIEALSEEEIGQVFVKGKTVIVKDLPPSASAQVNNTEIEITPGTDIQFVASFLLEVVGPQNNPVVCVIPVETQDKRTIIFGEKDSKPDYPSPSYENRDDGYGNGYEYQNEMSSYDKKYDYDQRY
ncbi:MAG TPA: hypothetical protein VFU79_09190 [Nitrososphaeraceae archaeon]|nr:hypothetical protein [Nitrososphaeraceae archaeon]